MTDRIRASDAEREEYAQILRAAMTEGRLTLEEGEERLASVYAAKYRDELPPLANDLPGGGRQAVFDAPEAKQERRRHHRRHTSRRLGFVAVMSAILVGLWALFGGGFFWPIIPLAFFGIGFLRSCRYARYGHPSWRGSHWSGQHGQRWAGRFNS
jgi:hypothetical protein